MASLRNRSCGGHRAQALLDGASMLKPTVPKALNPDAMLLLIRSGRVAYAMRSLEQVNHPLLGVGIAFDVPLRRLQAGMTGKLLDVAQ